MAPITTIEDVENLTGRSYSPAEEARLTVLLPIAERNVARRAGRVFYDADSPEGDASQDWLLVVSKVVDRMLRNENPAVQTALSGPFQSESLGGDYSYSLRTGVSTASLDPLSDSTITDIIDQYQVTSASSLTGLVVSGPTRVAPPFVEYDVSRGDCGPY